jgi:hypothetical protein
MMALDFSEILARADMAAARRRLARLALALERYRLEQGEYPGSLEELALHPGVATGDRSILLDPLTGEPFAYEPSVSGYRLASKGNDEAVRAGQPALDANFHRDPVLEWRIER